MPKPYNTGELLRCLAIEAYNASIAELDLTPKPGLVDKNNSGSHNDMDYYLMRKGADSLKPFWYRFLHVAFGFDEAIADALTHIRRVGIEAEKSMFEATGGVNTHKGLIFLMGILLFAIGLSIKERKFFSLHDVSLKISEIAQGLVECELKAKVKNRSGTFTHGEEVFHRYGVGGARQEAESGLKTVFDISLPLLQQYVESSSSVNEAYLRTLLELMCVVDDTNVLYRGGMGALLWMKEKSRKTLMFGEKDFFDAVNSLDREFIRMGISPGGAADLLTITIFLYQISNNSFTFS